MLGSEIWTEIPFRPLVITTSSLIAVLCTLASFYPGADQTPEDRIDNSCSSVPICSGRTLTLSCRVCSRVWRSRVRNKFSRKHVDYKTTARAFHKTIKQRSHNIALNAMPSARVTAHTFGNEWDPGRDHTYQFPATLSSPSKLAAEVLRRNNWRVLCCTHVCHVVC